MVAPQAAEKFLSGRVVALVADITHEDVDVIVNAANSSLLGGGGVDGAIHGAGGPEILEQCREIRRTRFPNGLPTGEAVMTTGGNLRARHVIHTVGPVFGRHGGREAELLAACYKNSLMLCTAHKLTSIAFPAISTGIFAYPRDEAAVVASRTIEEFLRVDSILKVVRLVFYQPSDMQVFVAHQSFTDPPR
jgi:O-acetyl-ADP-ribose deacetylase (regulator of RNase III)